MCEPISSWLENDPALPLHGSLLVKLFFAFFGCGVKGALS